MTNEIVIEPNYGVIIFHDKSRKYITQTQFNKLVMNWDNPNLKEIHSEDGSMFSKGSISKVLTLEEFSNEYPHLAPEPVKEDQFKKYEGLESRPIGRNGLASLISGMERAIREFQAEGKTPHRAIAERDRLVKKFENQYGGRP